MSSEAGKDRVVLVFGAREDGSAPAGGIHKAVLAQIAALLANGVAVSLLTASRPCAEAAVSMGAEVDYSPIWHNGTKPLVYPSFAWKLLRLRWGRHVRCVIHHSGRTWFWGYVFFPGVPQVQVFHREVVRPYRFFRRWLALSPAYAEKLRAEHSLGGWRKVAWAPNGLIEMPGKVEAPSPTEEGVFTLGFIGRSSPGKGTEILLDALKLLVGEGMKVRLRFAGDGREYVEGEAAARGLEENVEFTGSHHDLSDFIDSLDLLVLPSMKESFGLVIIESMARAKPVLTTDCHGPRSIVMDGETGYVIPIGETEALASGIRKARDDAGRVEKGMAGYRRVLDAYTPEPVGRRLVSALRELGARLQIDRSR